MLLHQTPSSRWEVPPATPRAVIACEELKRLAEWRREKDGAMARRIREAELRYDQLRTPHAQRYVERCAVLAVI